MSQGLETKVALSSAVDVFLGVEQVQESVLVLVPLVGILNRVVLLEHVLALGHEHEALLTVQRKFAADDGKHLAHGERFGHEEPARWGVSGE